MHFTESTPSQNYIHRLVDGYGLWEIGFERGVFVTRIKMGKIGEEDYIIDYNAGEDIVFAAVLLQTIVKILEPISAEISSPELKNMFPLCKIEPINKDPCWEKLQKMTDLNIQWE